MTDQPRDLAAEVERVIEWAIAADNTRTEYGPTDGGTASMHFDHAKKDLLQQIAALSRELEEHREALRWATLHGVQRDQDHNRFVVCDNDEWRSIEPPAHLAPILAKALEGES